MPKLSVLVHSTEEEYEKLDRTLSSVQFADDIMVVLDQDGEAPAAKIVHKLKGRTKPRIPGVSPGTYAMDAFYDWILVLASGEWLDDNEQQRILAWRSKKAARKRTTNLATF
jgi:hypothetical protein